MMRPFAGIPIALLAFLATAHAQQEGISSESAAAEPYLEIGADPVAVMTLPLGSLESIRGSVPCSPTFAAAPSVNLGAGLRVSYLLRGDTLSGTRPFLRAISLAAGYDDLSSRFVSSPGELEAYDPVNGRYTGVRSEHTAEFTLGYLRAALEAETRLGDDIILRAGPAIGIPISGEAREREAILSPENATFLDRTQEREIPEGTGDLDAPGIRISIGASIGYRLRLGENIFFEPNIGADIGLTSVQPSWTPLLVRGGIGIIYALVPNPEPVAPPQPPPPPPPVAEQIPEQQKEIPFTADLLIEATPPRIPVEFRRQIVARYVPLLPAVFFDPNSAAIPERYAQLAPPGEAPRGGQADSFDEAVSSAGNAERAHHQTLNLFGSRLRRSPGARITITGTTGSDEENRMKLAGDRASAVADYLADVWEISRERIVVRSRLDPSIPSNAEYPEGRAENRRVELEFSDESIYRPVQLRSVEPITEPADIPFHLEASSPLGISRWEVKVAGMDGSPLERIGGDGAPPQNISWELTNADREKILSTGSAVYTLAVFDSTGRSVLTRPQELPLRTDTTISVTSSADKPDNAAEFLLVTFDFNRADLTRRGRQELKAILDRIGPNSRVSVTGYTDQTGDQTRNIALATERARRVASLMPKGVEVESRGAAPEEAPYNGDSPEGRFLSRTVRVVIANPK